MDRDCAIIVVSAAVNAARHLTGVVSLIDSSDERIKMSVSELIFDIMENIISPIQEEHPLLKDEMESRMERYGRMF
jgi:hypothetical protein